MHYHIYSQMYDRTLSRPKTFTATAFYVVALKNEHSLKSSNLNEDDKLAAVKAGYGATDHDKVTKKLNGYEVAVVEPMQSQDQAANYSVTSPDFAYSDEEEGEAITKPLKSLTTVSEQISDEDMLDNRSDLSSSPS